MTADTRHAGSVPPRRIGSLAADPDDFDAVFDDVVYGGTSRLSTNWADEPLRESDDDFDPPRAVDQPRAHVTRGEDRRQVSSEPAVERRVGRRRRAPLRAAPLTAETAESVETGAAETATSSVVQAQPVPVTGPVTGPVDLGGVAYEPFDTSWWEATDGRFYPPELHPSYEHRPQPKGGWAADSATPGTSVFADVEAPPDPEEAEDVEDVATVDVDDDLDVADDAVGVEDDIPVIQRKHERTPLPPVIRFDDPRARAGGAAELAVEAASEASAPTLIQRVQGAAVVAVSSVGVGTIAYFAISAFR